MFGGSVFGGVRHRRRRGRGMRAGMVGAPKPRRGMVGITSMGSGRRRRRASGMSARGGLSLPMPHLPVNLLKSVGSNVLSRLRSVVGLGRKRRMGRGMSARGRLVHRRGRGLVGVGRRGRRRGRGLVAMGRRRRHLGRGNRFTDFFKNAANKVKDAFTKPVKLPGPVKSVFNFIRDKVNPAIQTVSHAIADSGIPVASTVFKPFAKVMDIHQKYLGPQGKGRRHRRMGRGLVAMGRRRRPSGRGVRACGRRRRHHRASGVRHRRIVDHRMTHLFKRHRGRGYGPVGY